MKLSATLSPNGDYRYKLSRVWDESLPTLVWVMLNPSTADAYTDDATIKKCMGFARQWGYGGIVVVNLYAFRTTDPKYLFRELDFVGPENDITLAEVAGQHKTIVCAWGLHAKRQRARLVCKLLTITRDRLQPPELYCLGLTSTGMPKHPVRLAYSTPLEEFKWWEM